MNNTVKRVHIVQHEEHETSGHIADWLIEKNLKPVHLMAQDGFGHIEPEDIAFLIILGGATNVHDQPQPAWLEQEKIFLAKILQQPCPVLGICLGGQLLADALGANVQQNEMPEIGWHEVEFDFPAMEKAGLPKLVKPDAFVEWHDQTFDIPDLGTRWASSQYCRNQAFVANGRHVGLQFHPEWTRQIVSHVANSEPAESNGKNIQELAQLLDQDFDLTRPFLWGLLDHLWSLSLGEIEGKNLGLSSHHLFLQPRSA